MPEIPIHKRLFLEFGISIFQKMVIFVRETAEFV